MLKLSTSVIQWCNSFFNSTHRLTRNRGQNWIGRFWLVRLIGKSFLGFVEGLARCSSAKFGGELTVGLAANREFGFELVEAVRVRDMLGWLLCAHSFWKKMSDDVAVVWMCPPFVVFNFEIQSQFSQYLVHTNSVSRAVFFVRIVLKFRTWWRWFGRILRRSNFWV